jgi:hypothetical protein
VTQTGIPVCKQRISPGNRTPANTTNIASNIMSAHTNQARLGRKITSNAKGTQKKSLQNTATLRPIAPHFNAAVCGMAYAPSIWFPDGMPNIRRATAIYGPAA